jgi:hypothetical protein
MSVGCATCLEPAPGVFNEVAFQHLDLAIAEAARYGLRLVFPLVDNYQDTYGSWQTYERWNADTSGVSYNFYNNAADVASFEQFIQTVLTRVNSMTGVPYADDPTILGWETGNEIGPPISWTATVSAFIKSIDPNHLVVDGTYGINDGNPYWGSAPRAIPETCPNSHSALCLPDVDIYSNHSYPPNTALMTNDADAVASVGKAFVVGEYAWNNVGGGDPLSGYLPGLEADHNVSGDLFWSLWPHADDKGYVQHADGYTLHYPGDTSDMRARAQQLRSHGYAMRGLAVPAHDAVGAPTITFVGPARQVSWRGVAGGDLYTVQISTVSLNGPWTTICSACATDNDTPWPDPSPVQAAIIWYRVQAQNLDGLAGPWSAVYEWPA